MDLRGVGPLLFFAFCLLNFQCFEGTKKEEHSIKSVPLAFSSPSSSQYMKDWEIFSGIRRTEPILGVQRSSRRRQPFQREQ